MNWFDTNPYGNNPTFMQSFRWNSHRLGRSMFTSNFSRNGMSAMLFAPTPWQAAKATLSKTHEFGSSQHIANLRSFAAQNPENKSISKALTKAEAKQVKKTFGKKLGGFVSHHALNSAFYGLTFATTEGSLAQKSKATISEMAGMAIGWKGGMAAGAALGTAIMPVIGTGIGALAGALGGQIGVSAATQFVFDTSDRMVNRERERRNLNWVGDTTAFNTQGAYTMRQQSLSAMNRGMSTARSALGREAIIMHQ